MRKTFVYLQYPKLLFADRLYAKSKKCIVHGKSIQQLIDEDMPKYMPKKVNYPPHGFKALNYLLATNKIFRNVFYFRIGLDNKLASSIKRAISLILVPKMENIEIGTHPGGFIDGGLKIVHKAGCVCAPYIAGKNLSVFQGVTVGHSILKEDLGVDCPTIGNNVTIMSNAVVFGEITIGDDAIIGAGSIVSKDVPAGSIVVGNPARIVQLNKEKVNIPL